MTSKVEGRKGKGAKEVDDSSHMLIVCEACSYAKPLYTAVNRTHLQQRFLTTTDALGRSTVGKQCSGVAQSS